MTLVVQTAIGAEGANSYVSLEEFKSYTQDRADISSLKDTDINRALVCATDYIDKQYGQRFIGNKLETTQILEWPREKYGYRNDRTVLDVLTVAQSEYLEEGAGVPFNVKKAVFIVAYSILNGVFNEVSNIQTETINLGGGYSKTVNYQGKSELSRDLPKVLNDTIYNNITILGRA